MVGAYRFADENAEQNQVDPEEDEARVQMST